MIKGLNDMESRITTPGQVTESTHSEPHAIASRQHPENMIGSVPGIGNSVVKRVLADMEKLKELDAKDYPLAHMVIPEDLMGSSELLDINQLLNKQSSYRLSHRQLVGSSSQTQVPDPTSPPRKRSSRLPRGITSQQQNEHESSVWLSLDGTSSRPTSGQSYETAVAGDSTGSLRVATPPLTAADTNIDLASRTEEISSLVTIAGRPDPVIDPDASLPSPRLSPTFAASAPMEVDTPPPEDALMLVDGPSVAESLKAQLSLCDGYACPNFAVLENNAVGMLKAFDSMLPNLQSLMMAHLLRRCHKETIRTVASMVNPSLQCDFLRRLPIEMCYEILSYLDCRDLCRAAQVSKWWRQLIDTHDAGWWELFVRDGYTLAAGEEDMAIARGWGWQDPVGYMDSEVDLSSVKRLSLEAEYLGSAEGDNGSPLRSSKRKRNSNSNAPGDRPRRRLNESSGTSKKTVKYDVVKYKRRGPLAAAAQAAVAVPNPNLGLPSLQNCHLYKSLYRRHHMIRRSWMNGKVPPRHIAFAAHPRNVITCLQFDEKRIITGSDDTQIHVYNTETGRLLKRLEGHEGGVWALQYEGNTLVSGSTDRTVRVWNIEKGICTQVFQGHTSTVRCLQILIPSEIGRDANNDAIMAPKKPLIITGSRDYNLRVWRLPEANETRWNEDTSVSDSECPYFIRTLSGHTHSVRAIAAHADTLVSGSYDNTVRVWKISTGEAKHVLEGHTQKVYSVVLDSKRNRCISGSMDSMVKVWDLETGSCIFTLEGHSHLVGLLDLREGRLVSAAADSTLRIWDPEDGSCKTVLAAHTGAITCFQHDSTKVISGSEKAVKMWNIATGQCVKDLLTDLTAVWQVKFDSRRCVAAVQRDALTYVEILDFGAVRDGCPRELLGFRDVVNRNDVLATPTPQAVDEE